MGPQQPGTRTSHLTPRPCEERSDAAISSWGEGSPRFARDDGRAREDDFAQWLSLWKGYQHFYKTEIADATTAMTWSRFHDPAEPMHCAVAELDGKLIGIVHYIQHRSCWTMGDYVYLQDLFVDSDIRGKGVGRALIEHVYASAAEAGASRVWWLTHESNAHAMFLYDRIADKSGFIQYRKLM